MHSIVKEFIQTSELLVNILEKNYDKNQCLEVVFYKLSKSLILRNIDPQLYVELDQAIVNGHSDPELYFLFIAYALSFTSGRHQKERPNVIQSIGQLLPREKFNTILQSYFLLSMAQFKLHENNNKEANNLLNQAIAIIDKKSPRFITILGSAASILAFQGKLKVISNEDLGILEVVSNDYRRLSFVELKIINNLVTGNFREGFVLIEEYKKLFKGDAKNIVTDKEDLLKILSGEFNEAHYHGDFFKLFANSCKYLSCGNYSLSKEYIIKLEKGDWSKVWTLKMDKYLPLHLELNLKNKGKARWMISEIEKRGESHYLDDFFLARVYLLENEKAKAFEVYSRLMANVNRFGALLRLAFEMKFAKEIKSEDILLLTNGVYENFVNDENQYNIDSVAKISNENKNQKLLVGKCESIIEIKKKVKKYADLKDPILVLGETGTGKEIVAKSIHESGKFKDEPFIAINCGGLTDTLLESELFGYEAGAFTGAIKQHKGIFESAGKGTVFLDEFGEISSKLQVTLLRVLESNEIRMIGANKNKQIECKIVVATNIDLYQAVLNKKFRQDLYFRLARFDIKLPPLRERSEDIPLLVDYFLKQKASNAKLQMLSTNLMRMLLNYSWPGNIRELKNEIERLSIMHSDKEILDVEDFDFSHLQGELKETPIIKNKSKSIAPSDQQNDFSFAESEDKIEEILKRGSKISQRQDFIKTLFQKYKKLTRSQIIEIVNISPVTAMNDLKVLCETGDILRVTPTKSYKSHYYILNEG